MFIYIVQNGAKLKIDTPWMTDFSKIKKEILQSSEKNVVKMEYPNGLVLDIEQKADQITVYSNRPLIENPDGSFTAPKD